MICMSPDLPSDTLLFLIANCYLAIMTMHLPNLLHLQPPIRSLRQHLQRPSLPLPNKKITAITIKPLRVMLATIRI